MESQTNTSHIASLFSTLYGLELNKPGTLDKYLPKIPETSYLKPLLQQAKAQAIEDRQLLLNKKAKESKRDIRSTPNRGR